MDKDIKNLPIEVWDNLTTKLIMDIIEEDKLASFSFSYLRTFIEGLKSGRGEGNAEYGAFPNPNYYDSINVLRKWEDALKESLDISFTKIPLYLNTDNSLVKFILNWRLRSHV